MRPKKNKEPLRWVIGTHACKEAILQNPSWVLEVIIQDTKARDHEALEKLCSKQKLPVKTKGGKFLNSIAEGHQGVAVALNDRPRWSDESADRDSSLVVMLDGITDPHNLGAILRTAWLLEVDGLFIPKNRSVDLTPVVCKVASGGAEHVPVESIQFQSQISWFKEKGYWIYGLAEAGKQSLPQTQFAEKSVIIVGSEGAGMRSSTQGFCDQLIRIPQAESGSSYNASVAFALCVYEAARSRFL
ncbi:MAG: 23S rRNA (guanosine(2251)-2'-O)-methyltransferase RlmB [Bdellovibrionales bacterium]|nr:23S rRNA (guanosine(2251)-2'-O)-methyltransferase RlmB [Bdellovibrionales bacterium]